MFFLRPAAAHIDQLEAAKNSRLNARAATRNLERLFQQMYRRYFAGLPPDHLMVEHRPPVLRAASSAESCS
jgi:hypothetical protein